ncbi:MAG: DNA polymerase III, delta prime subunit, putative [Microgenomates bacterium 39_7]|nr:MAG: DNA polymerase III, delta prime subunit, putative [Microgenomates bacterium 39_7]
MNTQNPSKKTSLMLVVSPQDDQLEQLYTYLHQEKLIESDLRQFKVGNLPSIHLYNREQKGLKIEDVREIIEISSFANFNSQLRIIAILDAQQSSIPAQNALLKIVEEPPNNTLVVLVSAYPKQLLPTIHSRCNHVLIKQANQTENQTLSATPNKTTINTYISQKVMNLARLILNSEKFSYSQAIDIAADYKKREEALELISQLMDYLHLQISLNSDSSKEGERLTSKERSRAIFLVKQLLEAHQNLLKNLNPSLTLEHYLFNLVDYQN